METPAIRTAWEMARDQSKIRRVDWKKILGKSLTTYLRDWKTLDDATLMKVILLKVKPHINELRMDGWTMEKIGNNLRISLSARRTEQKIYGRKY